MIGRIRSWQAPDGAWYPSTVLPQFPKRRGELPPECPGHEYWLAPDGSWFPKSTPPRYSSHHVPGETPPLIGSHVLNMVEAVAVGCLVLATVVAAFFAGGILLIGSLTLIVVVLVGVGLARLFIRWRRSSTT